MTFQKSKGRGGRGAAGGCWRLLEAGGRQTDRQAGTAPSFLCKRMALWIYPNSLVGTAASFMTRRSRPWLHSRLCGGRSAIHIVSRGCGQEEDAVSPRMACGGASAARAVDTVGTAGAAGEAEAEGWKRAAPSGQAGAQSGIDRRGSPEW